MRTRYVTSTAEPAIILGFDISSVSVGYAVFRDLDLIDKGKYLQQGKYHCEKLSGFLEWLLDTFKKYDPTHIVIEMPHGGGRTGRAYTVLMMYITAVYIAYYRHFNREFPDACKMYPNAVKSALGVQTTKNHEQNKKVMVDHINKLFGLSLRYTPDVTKRTSDDDISDAIAVTVAWILRSGRDDGRYNSKQNRPKSRTRKTRSSRS